MFVSKIRAQKSVQYIDHFSPISEWQIVLKYTMWCEQLSNQLEHQ